MEKSFHSNGKLLLTSEYLIIDRALALALPCKYGQWLRVRPQEEPLIHWKSFSSEGDLWYKSKFRITEDGIISKMDVEAPGAIKNMDDRLLQILNVLYEMNPSHFRGKGYQIETELEFPSDWGLGSSSTLLVNLAEWVSVDPYVLSSKTFGGSGYDIACGMHDGPIIYQVTDSLESPKVGRANFDPDFKDRLFFVHRNQKQNTREAVAHYRKQKTKLKRDMVKEISAISLNFLYCKDFDEFENLIYLHERIISECLGLPVVKEVLFPDYPGAVKSLGAWGGDFILATGTYDQKEYFREKGYQTVVSYSDMVL